jgi:hypothetical protein
MASVYLRENSKNWECAFYLPNHGGKARKVRKSIGTSNLREAQRVAIELERKARDLARIDQVHCQEIHTILNQAGEDALKQRLTATKARTYLSEILKLSTGEDPATGKAMPEWHAVPSSWDGGWNDWSSSLDATS